MEHVNLGLQEKKGGASQPTRFMWVFFVGLAKLTLSFELPVWSWRLETADSFVMLEPSPEASQVDPAAQGNPSAS